MENEVKEPALKYNYTTAEECLEFERASLLEKHELHEGTIITMTGASLRHNKIVRNLIVGIGSYFTSHVSRMIAYGNLKE